MKIGAIGKSVELQDWLREVGMQDWLHKSFKVDPDEVERLRKEAELQHPGESPARIQARAVGRAHALALSRAGRVHEVESQARALEPKPTPIRDWLRGRPAEMPEPEAPEPALPPPPAPVPVVVPAPIPEPPPVPEPELEQPPEPAGWNWGSIFRWGLRIAVVVILLLIFLLGIPLRGEAQQRSLRVQWKDEGSILGTRGGGNLWIIDCTGAGIACTQAGATVTVNVTGGGATGYQTIEDEGSGLTQRTILNFIGAGVNCVDNVTKTDCTISGGGGGSWSDLTDPTAVVVLNSDAVAELFQTRFTATYGATDILLDFQQLTGNPVAGSEFMRLTVNDPDMLPFAINDGTNTVFQVERDADTIIRNFADQDLVLVLSSGAGVQQDTQIVFRNAAVNEYRLEVNSSNTFQIVEDGIAQRVQLFTGGNNTWRSGSTTADHVFQDSAATEYFRVLGTSGGFQASDGTNTIFDVQSDADTTIRNFADQGIVLILDAGATANQTKVIEFRDRTALNWKVGEAVTGRFRVDEAVARIDLISGSVSQYFTGSTATDHIFGNSGGTIRARILGDADTLCLGPAEDTCLNRSAAGILDVIDVVDANTGFRIAGAAAAGNYLRGDATNFVSSAILTADIQELIAFVDLTDIASTTGSGTVGVFATAPTFITSITTPVLISGAADPADAGFIRMGNNQCLQWELATPGADGTFCFNASDEFEVNAPFKVNSGGTDQVQLGSGTNLSTWQHTFIEFEGVTDNAFETRFSITDPTVDRTVTVPNAATTIHQPFSCTNQFARSSASATGLVTCATVDLANDVTGVLVAGSYGAASIDGDDINSNLAGSGLVLTAAAPDTLDIDLIDVDDQVGSSSNESGMEFGGTGGADLGLLRGCANTEILKFNTTGGLWECQADVSGGSPSLDTITAAVGTASINSGDNAIVWNWQLTTASKNAFEFTENAAGTATGDAVLIQIATLAASTVHPLEVTSRGDANGIRVGATDGIVVALGTGGLDWPALLNYPAGCTNQFVVTIADTLTCGTVTASDTDETTFTGVTWGANADFVWNYNTVGGANPDSVISFTSANVNVSTGVLQEGGVNVVVDSLTLTVAGTANEITSSAGAQDLSVNRTWTLSLPATIDLGGKTSFEIPNAAAPVVDAFGEIAGDNDFYAASRGVATFFDGTSAVHLVGVLNTSTASSGQVPTFVTGGTVTWQTPSGSGDVTAVGPGCADGECWIDGTVTTGTVLLVWEGTGADANEFTINVPANPGADISWTIPDAVTALTFPSGTDTLVGRATTDTLTNKTMDVEATGNALTTVSYIEWQSSTCVGATATSNFDDSPLLAEPAAACVAGTNITSARLDFDDSTDEGMQISFVLPTGFTGTVDFDFYWHGTNTTNEVRWALQTVCVADAETLDPSFNAAQTVDDTAKGTANQLNRATISTVTLTGCAAEERMFLQMFRDADNAADDFVGDARLVSTRLTLRRTQ